LIGIGVLRDLGSLCCFYYCWFRGLNYVIRDEWGGDLIGLGKGLEEREGELGTFFLRMNQLV
jgi:hypothetical protein